MVEVVNLRRARKRKRRDDKQRDAAANRLLHGRSAGEKTRSRREKELGDKRLDDHLRNLPADTRRDRET